MNAKISAFIYAEAIMYLLLYNLLDCTFFMHVSNSGNFASDFYQYLKLIAWSISRKKQMFGNFSLGPNDAIVFWFPVRYTDFFNHF